MTVDLHCWTLNPYSVLVLGLDAGELGAAVVVGVPLCPLTTYHQKIFTLQNFSYFWSLTLGEFGSTISVFYFCPSEVGQRETEEETRAGLEIRRNAIGGLEDSFSCVW